MECTPGGSDKTELLDLDLLAAPETIRTVFLRKQLAELLVLSKLDYCNCLYGSLPEYLLKRLQKVQTLALEPSDNYYRRARSVQVPRLTLGSLKCLLYRPRFRREWQ